MDNQWKCETCGTCDFVVNWSSYENCIFEGQCRKNPPCNYSYPVVRNDTPACSCWRNKGENNES